MYMLYTGVYTRDQDAGPRPWPQTTDQDIIPNIWAQHRSQYQTAYRPETRNQEPWTVNVNNRVPRVKEISFRIGVY